MLGQFLSNNIRDGKAILFLGAGASIGAKSPDGNTAPTSKVLIDLICDTFLGGKKKDWPLSRVADYAKVHAGLQAVQELIRDQLIDLQPADFHKLIPMFNWHAIVTTNYDQIIEKAYSTTPDRLQTPKVFIRSTDNFSESMANPKAVPVLKLHGCISVVNDPQLPLILASEEYSKYEEGRRRLFSHFKNWAVEHSVIFCGYDIADPNIQSILFSLEDQKFRRPLYGYVMPSIDELDKTVWGARRFVTAKATFQEFMEHLDVEIPKPQRKLSMFVGRDTLSVKRWFNTQASPSDDLIAYLSNDLIHVGSDADTEGVTANAFYRGETQSWACFRQNLDVTRRVNDDIIANWVFSDSSRKAVQCSVLRGHAGSGKSVALRRAAWDAATVHDELIFFLKEDGSIKTTLIEELYSLVNRPIVLFIDDVIRSSPQVVDLLEYFKHRRIPLLVIGGARTNEWNVAGESLTPFLLAEYVLRDLSEREIAELLEKLETHGCLGHLNELTLDQRIQCFTLTAERQLLVALHEATSGKTFEEIVKDEYSHIVPPEARILYLDVCTLHRLGAPVRAGLIHRVSGVSFDHFQKKLLGPLEHVIKVSKDLRSRDFVYKSRHPLVAEFVFEQVLNDPEKRVDQIVRLLGYMNDEYETDRVAFGRLISGKLLAEEFGHRELADHIYEVAQRSATNQGFVMHQRAVFENHHPGGSAKRALEFLDIAEEKGTSNINSLNHTRAMALRKLASRARSVVEADKLRQKSKKILEQQISRVDGAYPLHGIGLVLIDEIRERLGKTSSLSGDADIRNLQQQSLVSLIADAEQVISVGLQRYPEHELLLSLQADLAEVLQQQPLAVTALENAFKANVRSDRTAVRLARHYKANGSPADAQRILQQCRDNNPSSKIVHYELALLYIDMDEATHRGNITFHLKRSFTEGDNNLSAQMTYARHEFLYGEREEGIRIFKTLRSVRCSPSFMKRTWGEVGDGHGGLVEYHGYISEITNSFSFASIENLNRDVFIYRGNFTKPEDWSRLTRGCAITCNLAFTLRGPCGINAVCDD